MSLITHHRASRLFGVDLAVLTLAATAAGCTVRPSPATAPPPAEIIQVGYGAQPRSAVTGAVLTATGEEIGGRAASRVEEMLEGRFAGLDVRLENGQYRMRIRGGSGEPLIVIDGIPSPLGLPNPLRDLAPTWVADVTVLKTAGATAIYGARGANGVILITTRRGR